ncbi:Anti-repressor SinI [Alkalicoccus daliensis]|uniref:Anti-repressor SinI n=1 Tax=Alkalicoccus daliensis TaxID=745820 RepID=A0A1H0CQ95_9BACI|nr:Anti-repressor SinI [Alkalicoccus daliensis]
MRERTVAEYLDWGGLIIQAKKQGISKQEIRTYLLKKGKNPIFFTGKCIP